LKTVANFSIETGLSIYCWKFLFLFLKHTWKLF
jgi:hypothetical protein